LTSVCRQLTIRGIEKGDRAGKLESPSLVTLILKDSLNMMAQLQIEDSNSSDLTVFQFESFKVRFIGTADDPWWVAADVCKVLEIIKPENAYARLDDDEKDTRIVGTPGGDQKMICINESGLYSLILSSRKPQAKRFKKWVTREVIPTIRKTGSYSLSLLDDEPISPNSASSSKEYLSVQDQLAVIGYVFDGIAKTDVDRKILESAKISAIAAQFPQMAPALEATKQSLMLQTPDQGLRYNVTELGKTLAQKLGLDEDIKPTEINEALEQAGLQVAEYRTSSKDKKYKVWNLTEAGKSYGRILLQSARGNSKTVPSLRWLSEVLDEIAHLFVNQ
jgi:prophage antirepressor-like protein